MSRAPQHDSTAQAHQQCACLGISHQALACNVSQDETGQVQVQDAAPFRGVMQPVMQSAQHATVFGTTRPEYNVHTLHLLLTPERIATTMTGAVDDAEAPVRLTTSPPVWLPEG